MKPVMYVVVNKGLDMSAGKLAAQVGHAILGVTASSTYDWHSYRHRWMIILEAQDAVQLIALQDYLHERQVRSYLVIDEGVNEVPPFSYTALGVQILEKDSPQAEYLSALPLYRGDHRCNNPYTEGWNDAVAHMEGKPWWKRLRNKA